MSVTPEGARRTRNGHRYPKPTHGPEAQAASEAKRYEVERRDAARLVTRTARDDEDRALLLEALDLPEPAEVRGLDWNSRSAQQARRANSPAEMPMRSTR